MDKQKIHGSLRGRWWQHLLQTTLLGGWGFAVGLFLFLLSLLLRGVAWFYTRPTYQAAHTHGDRRDRRQYREVHDKVEWQKQQKRYEERMGLFAVSCRLFKWMVGLWLILGLLLVLDVVRRWWWWRGTG